ncbi:MAG: Octanoyltransferase LipM [Deltaproteobacteria bacterium]|nr:Octanoyltransferase LipM [Deltaproteobacteria bacterium]
MYSWRLIEDVPCSGSFNMAADQVLLDNFSHDEQPIFRLYDWECLTLSLGRNEQLDSLIDLQACQSLAIPVVRRMTGGKAVLHGFDLTYSLTAGVLDKQFPGGVLDNYQYLANGFMLFFKELGLNPELHKKSSLKKNQEPHICFAEPSAYEILIEGRKIIGSAQRVRIIRRKKAQSTRVFLQHGSILLKDSIPQIMQIFPYAREKNLRREIHSLESVGIYPKHSRVELCRLLLECLCKTFRIKWNNYNWTGKELKLIADYEEAFQPLEMKLV